MKEYRNYLFDMDGTLLDTTDLIVRSFDYACKKQYGISIESKWVYPLLGLPLRQSFQELLIEREHIDFDLLVDTYRKYQLTVYPKYLKIFPNVKSTLRQLLQRGKKIAVVTSRKRESAMLYLHQMKIDIFFDIVVASEDTSEHKPHPAPARKALDLLHGTPNGSLLIGDSFYDIECGYRCGTDTAFVLWSRSTYGSEMAAPTYRVRDMSGLVSFS